ncbi:MAG: primase-helicase zinc-binding domain-containing protein [Aeromonas sp.]
MNNANYHVRKNVVSDTAAAALGQWFGLLDTLGIAVPARGKHGPCPICGGSDRFRLDDKGGRGTWICNQCGAGDGLDLIQRITGKSPKEAAELVAGALGISPSNVAISEAEREQQRQQQRARDEADQQQRLNNRRKAACRAEVILRDCKRGQADYLSRKRLRWPDGMVNHTLIRIAGETFPSGCLVVPLYTEVGELVNVQLIRHDGVRCYLAGGQKHEAYHLFQGGELIAVCEGYATGLSIYLATGATVYCAMDCGNLKNVAEIARRQYPDAEIIIAGDHDLDKQTGGRNVHTQRQTEQAANAIGGCVAIPPVAGDWNDYQQAHGLEKTKEAIMGATYNTTAPKAVLTQPKQMASQGKAGADPILNVVDLRPATRQALTVPIDKLSASKRAELLAERLGMAAVHIESERVYRYEGSIWELVSDMSLRRDMARIFEENEADFSHSVAAKAVDTLKLMLPPLGVTAADLIPFSNGVYDMKARHFRPHSPDDGLLNHNGIEYGEPLPGETLSAYAPNFTKWLDHAAGSDVDKIERVKAALFMVLANRYDWQLFLEVTGEGGSGKSTMANLCELLVGGRNVGSSSMKRLESDFGLESVWDKRLLLLPDQPRYVGDGAVLKAITGGDEVSINQKGKAMFSAKVRAVVLATNNDPMVMTERNGGIARRRVIFGFNNPVADADRDPHLGAKIASELPVIIRHLLTEFADPERARTALLAQQRSADAVAVKRASDPLFDLCAMLHFTPEPNGLRMGGRADGLRDPRRFFYHLYYTYMDYHGLDRPLSVNAVARSLKQIAKELGHNYKTRTSNGTITNIAISDEVEAFISKPTLLEP